MAWIDPAVLIELFREQAEEKRRRDAWIENDIRFEDDRKRKLKEKEEKEDKERLERLVEASAAQIAEFREGLDCYDTATVQALMENRKALDELNRRIERMDASAYRLPDGRAVFKTEDGTRVFDRHGAEVSHEAVHPETIPDSAPRWEAMKASLDTERKLERERDDLHAFQHRLDETRETLDKGHVSADALAKMDADLRKAMPDVMKAELTGVAGNEAHSNAASLKVFDDAAARVKSSAYSPAGP